MGFLKCLVCYENVEGPGRGINLDQRIDSKVVVRDNSKGNKNSDTLLKCQVSIIFLVHSLLEVPLDECAKYLQNYGNPSQWIALCEKCNSILKEALDINDNIIKLQNHLKNIKRWLIDQIKIKVEKEDGTDDDGVGDDVQDPSGLVARNATQEIRQRICVSRIDNTKEFPEKDGEEFNNGIWSEFPLSEMEWKEEPELMTDPLSPTSMLSDQEDDSDAEWTPNLETNSRSILIPKRTEGVRKSNHHAESKTEKKQYGNKPLQKTYSRITVNSQLPSSKPTTDLPKTSTLQPQPESEGVRRSNRHAESKIEKKQYGNKPPLKTYSKKTPNSQSESTKPKPTLDFSESEETSNQKKRTDAIIEASTYSGVICPVCNRNFLTDKLLRNHKYNVHKFGIKCGLCEWISTNNYTYERHLRANHHPKSISVCSGCDEFMPTSRDFNSHLKKNPQCQGKAVECDICKGRFFSSQESLDLHKQITHIDPPPLPYHCFECNLHFTNKSILNNHNAEHHSGMKPFTCERCGKSFAQKRQLRSHLQNVHINKEPGGKKFPCGDCHLVFTRKGHLNRHRKLHGEESPYLCTVCGKRYKVGSQLTTHMWSHDPDRHSKYSLYMYKNRPKSKAKQNIVGKGKEETNVEEGDKDKERVPEVGETENDRIEDADINVDSTGSEGHVIQS